MQTHMKNNWADQVFEAMSSPYTTMIEASALWIDRQKIVLTDRLYIKDGMILPKKDAPDNKYTHTVVKLEATAANTKHRITLENLSTNEIETIDL